MKLFKDKTGIGVFRLTLFIILVASTTISAGIAIWAVIANGFENDTTWKILGTSGVIAGASLLLIFLTMTLHKKKPIDYIIVSLGLPAILYLVLTSLDSIYEWEILPNLFNLISTSDEYGYNKTYENTTISVVMLTALTLSGAFLRLVHATRLSKMLALVTEVFVSLWLALQFINIWWPELMGTKNQWGNYDLNEGWSKTQAVIGIIIGVSVITTFVLEVVGRARLKKTQTIVEITKESGKTVILDDETYSTLAGLALINDTTVAELIKEFAKEKDSKQ